MQFPHLTDTESVRAEAAQQYGGLSDAAAFQMAWRADQHPDTEAAALRHRNPEATADVQNDLSLAQEKIDEAFGADTYVVIDAAVRGDALSAIVEDKAGRTSHKVVGWTDRWKSIAPQGDAATERANAQAEAARGRLGAEARAEVQRMVQEATAGILSRVNALLGDKSEEVQQIRDEELAKVGGDLSDDDRARINAGLPVTSAGSRDEPGPRTRTSPSSTEGNDTSESSAGATAGDGDGGGSSGSEGAKWPRRHDALDEIAAANKVTFGEDDTTLDAKIAKLEAAGFTPPPEE